MILVRQFREAVQKELVELPAGVIDAEEAPLETAQRELQEETGYRGGSWSPGPVYYATPGYSRERVHLFVAEGVEPGDPAHDPGEPVEVELWSPDEIEGRLGEVEDSKTLIGAAPLTCAERAQRSCAFAKALSRTRNAHQPRYRCRAPCGSASSKRSSRTSTASR